MPPLIISMFQDRSQFDVIKRPLRMWLVALLLPVAGVRADEAIEREVKSGPVTAMVRLEPKEPLIGDTVTLTIKVTAEKDVELLMPEFGEALERFSIVDFAPRQSIDDQGRTVAVQTYRLQPPSSGKQAIPPILIEYVDRRPGQREAPEGYDAYELLTDRLEFEVKSVIPKNAEAGLKPALGKLGPREKPPAPRWPWVVVGLVLAIAVSPFVVKAYLASRRRARQRSAYEIARSRLKRLLDSPRPTGDQIDAFYVELSGIIRKYLEDRFELRAPELTTEEFLASVGESPDLSREHQALLREFLRQADLVKFARVQPSDEDIERSIEAAWWFLEETRENAPMLDVEEETEVDAVA